MNVSTPVSIGRIVHVNANDIANGECRPAMVVKVWSPDNFNGIVYLDGSNDDRTAGKLNKWVTSVAHRHPDDFHSRYEGGYIDWHWHDECIE